MKLEKGINMEVARSTYSTIHVEGGIFEFIQSWKSRMDEHIIAVKCGGDKSLKRVYYKGLTIGLG